LAFSEKKFDGKMYPPPAKSHVEKTMENPIFSCPEQL
jgi:hypothetical protein